MARLAARQSRHDAGRTEPVVNAEPEEPTPPAAPRAVDPEPEPESVGPPRHVTSASGQPDHDQPAAPAEPVAVENADWPSVPADADPSPADAPKRTGRRMASPPWQSVAVPMRQDPPVRDDRSPETLTRADEAMGEPSAPSPEPADLQPVLRLRDGRARHRGCRVTETG
jgi:hypothetical protein